MKPIQLLEKFRDAFKTKTTINIEVNEIFYTYVPGSGPFPAMLSKVENGKPYISDTKTNKWVKMFD